MPREAIVKRFWQKVNKDGPIPTHRPDLGRCWIWTAAIGTFTGYGVFRALGKWISAHRFSYLEFVGPIADGLEVDHLCRNRICVRPSHFEAVTRQVNQLRSSSVSGLNARKTIYVRGHSLQEGNVYIHCRRRVCKICHRAKTAKQRRGALSQL